MPNVNVVVAVNVGQALVSIAQGNTNIGQYVYMVDSTGYSNSGQGGHELVTTVTTGDTLVWQTVSIDPTETVVMTGFTGTAIGTNPAAGQIINPVQYPQYNPPGSVWGGYVNSNSNGKQVQYSISLLLNGGAHGWFDPFIISNVP